MDIFELMRQGGHEQIIFNYDKETGMRAIIAIHDTTLGNACGGTRMVNYASMEEALKDAMRLSKAMTYKRAASDEDKGGGKGVIWGDPEKDKTQAYLRAYGRFIEILKGRFITGAADLNLNESDSSIMGRESRYILARPKEEGSSGNTGAITAFGVFLGVESLCPISLGHSRFERQKHCCSGARGSGGTFVEPFERREGWRSLPRTSMKKPFSGSRPSMDLNRSSPKKSTRLTATSFLLVRSEVS